MSYVNMDDNFSDHPKNASLSDAAFRLHVAGICYSSRHLTDGVIAADEAPRLVRRFKRPALNELLDRGLWIAVDDGAFTIHDYLDWNPSRAVVLDRKENARKAAKKRWS